MRSARSWPPCSRRRTKATLQYVGLHAKKFLMTIDLALGCHVDAFAARKDELAKAYGALNEETPSAVYAEIDATYYRGQATNVSAMMASSLIEFKDSPTTLKKKSYSSGKVTHMLIAMSSSSCRQRCGKK